MLTRIFCLLAAVGLTMAIIAMVTPGSTSIAEVDYLSATNDKHRVLAATPSPKIVLVGGSNMALGVDSARIEQALGRPVVNMGLYAGLGLRFMVDEIRQHVGAGDTIYVAPEYQLFFKETRRNDDAIATLVRVSFPDSASYVPPMTLLGVVGTLWADEQKAVGDWIVSTLGVTRTLGGPPQTAAAVEYFRGGFDPRGDYVSHLGKAAKDLSGVKLHNQKELTFDDDSVAALNAFQDFAAGRGARVILGYPPLPDNLYHDNRKLLDDLHARLARDLRATVVGTPAQATLPRSMFYDTIYHLIDEGRQARTDRVIQELRAAGAAAR